MSKKNLFETWNNVTTSTTIVLFRLKDLITIVRCLQLPLSVVGNTYLSVLEQGMKYLFNAERTTWLLNASFTSLRDIESNPTFRL